MPLVQEMPSLLDFCHPGCLSPLRSSLMWNIRWAFLTCLQLVEYLKPPQISNILQNSENIIPEALFDACMKGHAVASVSLGREGACVEPVRPRVPRSSCQCAREMMYCIH